MAVVSWRAASSSARLRSSKSRSASEGTAIGCPNTTTRPRERVRHQERIPGPEDGAGHGGEADGHHGGPGHLGQQDGAGLGDVPGSARPVRDDEDLGAVLPHQPRQGQQGPATSPRGRAAHDPDAESLDESAQDLAVAGTAVSTWTRRRP